MRGCRQSLAILLAVAACGISSARAQETKTSTPEGPAKSEKQETPARTKTAGKSETPEKALQRAIDASGSDSAALVRNLEAYLRDYPDTPRRAPIYRALVEAELQLRNDSAAADYAERLVALSPEDMSITLLAIQLIERTGEPDALKRAASYATRLIEHTEHDDIADKSPRVSPREWEDEHRRLRMTLLFLRGRLEMRLNERAAARADFQASYLAEPNRSAAEKLGELDELEKDLPGAIGHYCRAFLLDGEGEEGNSAARRAIRSKLGNVWKQVHGSEEGLGAFLLKAYDQLAAAGRPAAEVRNAGARGPYDYKLRRVAGGADFELSAARGKLLVLSFWATWCGPCREIEPQIERVAAQYSNNPEVLFLAVNGDEDESLVAPFLGREKSRLTHVFSDGLTTFFGVDAFPTVILLSRDGKVAFRSQGAGPEDFEAVLAAAVQTALTAPITSP